MIIYLEVRTKDYYRFPVTKTWSLYERSFWTVQNVCKAGPLKL